MTERVSVGKSKMHLYSIKVERWVGSEFPWKLPVMRMERERKVEGMDSAQTPMI